jgi:uncharacterized protein
MLSAAADAPGAWYGYLPLEEHPPLRSTPYGSFYFDWLHHPEDGDYWRRWSIEADYESITVPALSYGGWYDTFARGTVTNYAGLRERAGSAAARASQRLLVGPWQHVAWSARTGVLDHGAAAAAEIDAVQLRWFDRHLKDLDGGDEPPVRLFLMGRGQWLDESRWPPVGVVETPLFLRSGGRANSVRGDGALDLDPAGSEPPDVFVYDPLSPTLSQGGHACCYPAVSPIGPADQAAVESSGRVLVYTGRELAEELVVIGRVSLVLHAETDRLDTDFCARLCDVDPAGRSVNLLEGIVRGRYRDSLTEPTLLVPGEVYELLIDLGPVAHCFLPGHRVRLQVAGSDFPQWDRNLNTGEGLGSEGPLAALVATQVIHHSSRHPSRLLLPVARS